MPIKIRNGNRKKLRARPKEKDVPKNYDSMFEYNLHQGILKSWELHADKIPYSIAHTYHPDFSRKIGNKIVLIEAKGRFWDFAEYNKYIWIKKSLPKNVELVFLFANPSAPMPRAAVRRDGTKRTHAEWATANGFRWYSEESMPRKWIDIKALDGGEL